MVVAVVAHISAEALTRTLMHSWSRHPKYSPAPKNLRQKVGTCLALGSAVILNFAIASDLRFHTIFSLSVVNELPVSTWASTTLLHVDLSLAHVFEAFF